jgi:endo-1,4-beta-xylanase
MKRNILYAAILVLATIISSCNDKHKTVSGLKDAFAGDFLIGTAVNTRQILGGDAKAKPFINKQFNAITPENEMKWERIHPLPEKYNFTPADSIVSFARANGMFITGHTLIWHSQTPDWVFQDSLGNPLTRDALLERMKNHIFTVVGHYKGRVQSWDVVNEAMGDDGQIRKSKWYNIIGDDFIEKAFEFAHEADPDAELYYNDYNNEEPLKRAGVINIVRNLRNKGLRIDGVGIQGHWHLDSPDFKIVDEGISEYAALGVKVMITEMEINVLPTPSWLYGADISKISEYKDSLNPYVSGIPDSVQAQLTNRYANLFGLLLRNKDKVSRVTFWGVHDGYSWKNNWPIPGRKNYPLLFDRNYQPKPAYYAVIEEARKLK